MIASRIIPALLIALAVGNLVFALGLWALGDGKTAAGCLMGAAVAGGLLLAWEHFN